MAEKKISSSNDEMGKASYDMESFYKPRFNPLLVKYFSGIGSWSLAGYFGVDIGLFKPHFY